MISGARIESSLSPSMEHELLPQELPPMLRLGTALKEQVQLLQPAHDPPLDTVSVLDQLVMDMRREGTLTTVAMT